MIQTLHPFQHISGMVAGSHLIGRHTAKNRIRPARTLSCTFQVLFRFLAGTYSRHRIMLRQNTSLGYSREKVNKRDDGK